MLNLEKEAWIYGCELAIFAARNNLPLELFGVPDHMVIKATDLDDFGDLVRDEIIPKSKNASCVETEPRFKVAAKLTGRIALFDLGHFDWVEVDEPRIDQPSASVERAEFIYPSLERALQILEARKIYTDITEQGNRAFVGVKARNSSLEFRLTNTPLADVVDEQVERNVAIPISLANKKSNKS